MSIEFTGILYYGIFYKYSTVNSRSIRDSDFRAAFLLAGNGYRIPSPSGHKGKSHPCSDGRCSRKQRIYRFA